MDVKGRHKSKKHAPNDKFSVEAKFVLNESSDGIDVLNEDVEVTFGAFSVTIPAGSFKQAGNGKGKKGKKFTFRDKTLKIEFETKGRLKIDGKKLDLSAIDPKAPIEVGFRVGNDAGSATITLDKKGKFKR